MRSNSNLQKQTRQREESAASNAKSYARWGFFLLCLSVLTVGLVVYRRGGERVHSVVEDVVQRHFPNLNASFAQVRIDSNRGVSLEGVEWRPRKTAPDSEPILKAEEIYVECPIKLDSLVNRDFRPQKVIVRRPHLRANSDPKVFLEDLKLFCSESASPSSIRTVEIIDGTVEIISVQNGEPTTTREISGVNLLLTSEPTDAAPENTDAAPSEEESELSQVRVEAPRDVRQSEYTASISQVTIRPINYEEEAVPYREESREPAFFDGAVWTVEGSVSNPFVESATFSGKIDSKTWSFKGAAANLDLAEAYKLFSDAIAKNFATFDRIIGKTSLDFAASGSTQQLDAIDYTVKGIALDCAIVTSALRYPISEVETRYAASSGSASIDKFTARCGSTLIRGAYRQTGAFFSPDSASVGLRLDDLPLNDALLHKLIADAKSREFVSKENADKLIGFIDDYCFSATTNVAATLKKSPETDNKWSPLNVDISGTGVEFTYKPFPYKVDRLSGKVTLDSEETLTVELQSNENAQPTSIVGSFANALDAPRGQIDVIAKNRPIDPKLISASSESSQSVLLQLQPSGNIDVWLRAAYDPTQNPNRPLRIESAVNVRDGAVQYEYFPLPISSISGSIYMRDGAALFTNLTGKCGSASISANGSLASGKNLEEITEEFRELNATQAPQGALGAEFAGSTGTTSLAVSPAPLSLFASMPIPSNAPLGKDAWRFQLTSNVRNFPLGEDLRNALVKYERKDEFEKLNLEGKVNGQIRVAYRTDARKLSLEFDVQPTPESTSARPVGFPYELREIDGRFVYREGALAVEGLRAKSGRTVYSTNINSRTTSDGGWTLDLTSLRVDQFQIDRDLQSATSNQALSFLTFLNPTGAFNVDGAIHVAKGGSPQAKARASWDLRFIAQQNTARPFVQLDAICGSVKMFGTSESQGAPVIFGEVDLDSLYYKDLQISKLNGPFFFNGSDLFWGREAPPVQRTALYQDPFLKPRIDVYSANADAPGLAVQGFSERIGRRGASIPYTRAQAPENAAGFNADVNQTRPVEPQVSAPAPSLATTSDGRRSMLAQVFEGTVVSDGVYNVRETPTYRFTVNLHDGRLEGVTRNLAPGTKPLKGRIAARVSLQGEGVTVATLKGEGDVDIREAELYEFPQIIKIFQLLSYQESAQSSFSSATVKFQVIGDRIKLSNVLMSGDALTLFGDGWITLKGQETLVDLTLNSRLGGASSQIPIVSDVIGEVGDQISQIRVEGNLKTPVIYQEAAPGVKKAWWSVFPEHEPKPDDEAPVERARPIRDAWKKMTGKDKSE